MKRECEDVKSYLLENFQKEGDLENFPEEIKNHLEKCSECSDFKNGLKLSRRLFLNENLYTEELKLKTLNKIPVKKKEENILISVLVVLISILSAIFSLVIPIYLISRWVGIFFKNTHLNFFITISIHLIFGIVIAIFTYMATKEKRCQAQKC